MLISETKCVSDHPERVRRELRERVVERLERFAEFGVIAGPPVKVSSRSRRVGVVEHLFVVSLAFGELSVPVPEGVVLGSAYGVLHGCIAGEEFVGDSPHVGDELIGTVPDQEKEAMVAAGGINGGEFGG